MQNFQEYFDNRAINQTANQNVVLRTKIKNIIIKKNILLDRTLSVVFFNRAIVNFFCNHREIRLLEQ